jgi:hypothetical protein
MCLLVYTLCECTEGRFTYIDMSERCDKYPISSQTLQNHLDMQLCPFLEEVCYGYEAEICCSGCSEGWMRYNVDEM